MAATAVLIRKELRQHWLAFALLAALLGVATAALLTAHYKRGVSSSVFVGIGYLLQFALPGAAMVLCGRLVIAEYRARTQLFLEALPLSRWRMVTVKYFFGLSVLLSFVLLLLASAGTLFHAHEALTPRFAALLASRAGASAFLWYSFFFTTGLLGRYRWPIMIMGLVVSLFVSEGTSWDFKPFGPFSLLNQEFGSERNIFPAEALQSTLGVAGAISLVGFLLALVREGNVSALLAERMSHREKILVAVIMLGAVSAIAILDDRRYKKPYQLSGAVAAAGNGVIVKVAGPEDAAKPLADHLLVELGGLREYLGVTAFPPVLVTHREDLDAARYERGHLSKAEGFVVRVNYTSPEFDSDRFIAWLIPELLDHRSQGRTELEPGRWIRDGMGEFWVRRARIAEPLSSDRDLGLRAAYASPHGVRTEDLRDWYSVRERLGEGVVTGLAWSGLKTIALECGEEGCRRFLREMYARDVSKDIRATIRDRQNPWSTKLERTANLRLESFVQRWSDALRKNSDELGGELAALPRLSLDIQQHAATDVSRVVKWRLSATPPPMEEVEYRIRYLRSAGVDVPFEEDDLMDESARAELKAPLERELAESFSRGGRIIIGAALHLPQLGCEVISGWQRLDIGP